MFPGWFPFDRSPCPGCVVTLGERLSQRPRFGWLQNSRVLHRRASEADAVVFHIPTTALPIRVRRTPGQAWVAWSQESDAVYPQLADPAFTEQFDLTVSYRRDADVTIAYCDPGEWLSFRPPTVARGAYEGAPAVFIASGRVDRSGRTDYVRELMRHIAVDSYGRCLNNRSFEVDRGRPTKLQTLARYRFTLAFENSISADYVTEKFYDPLVAGSVPVYLGAPNVAEFAPAPHCYIDVRDFAGPRELARYLLELCADEHRYASYLEWHQRALDERFLALVSEQRMRPMCQLCAILRRRRKTGDRLA